MLNRGYKNFGWKNNSQILTHAVNVFEAGNNGVTDVSASLIEGWASFYLNGSTVGENSLDVQSVVSCGRNLFGTTWESGSYNSSTGAEADSTSSIRSVDLIPVKPSTVYRITCTCTITSGAFAFLPVFYDSAQNFISSPGESYHDATVTFSFTTPANCFFAGVRLWNAGTMLPSKVSNTMLNLGSTALTYEAYKSNTLDLSGIGSLATGAKSGNYKIWVYGDGGQISFTDANNLDVSSVFKYDIPKNQGFANV